MNKCRLTQLVAVKYSLAINWSFMAINWINGLFLVLAFIVIS